MNAPPSPSPLQLLQLVAVHHQAASAIDQLFSVIGKCSDPTLRAEAIHWLADIGARAGLRLHELAKDDARRAEVMHAATCAHFWPKIIAPHKRDQDAFDAIIPAKVVGSAKLSLGRASLDTLQVRWAFSFVQIMDIGRCACRRTQDAGTANIYLESHHGLTLDPEDIVLAGSLPDLSSGSIDQWSKALKAYLHRHFPGHGLAEHPDWVKDIGRTKSSDGTGLLVNDPKKCHATIIGRVNEALRQLARPKRATQPKRKLVARERRF